MYEVKFRTDVIDFRVLLFYYPVILGLPTAQNMHYNSQELPFAVLHGCIGLVGLWSTPHCNSQDLPFAAWCIGLVVAVVDPRGLTPHYNSQELPFAALHGCIGFRGLFGAAADPGKVLYGI